MNKYLTNIARFLFLLILGLPSNQSIADPEATFDYSQSVVLILKVEGGGHVYQRPDRRDPYNSFTQAFAIINKYIYQMQPTHSGLALDMSSLQAHDSFLLINHISTKMLYLGDHWLGDETAFAAMEPADYQTIKHIFDSRKRLSEATPAMVLDTVRDNIHKLWQEDSEEFYQKYYFPERDTLTSTKTSENSTSTSSYVRSSSSLNKNLRTSDISGTVPDQHSSSFANSSIAVTSINAQKENQPLYDAKSQSTNFLLKTLLGCILIVIAGYWWQRKRQ